jgi:hypothetical protein
MAMTKKMPMAKVATMSLAVGALATVVLDA